jgi:hypothetical protein
LSFRYIAFRSFAFRYCLFSLKVFFAIIFFAESFFRYYIFRAIFFAENAFRYYFFRSIDTIPPLQVNVPTMSKSNFENFHKDIILPNKHRINYLRLSNPFTVDIIFSPPSLICDYIQLEKLIFDNINSKYLNNILKHLIHLPKLHSLILSPVDYIQNPSVLFVHILRLTKLKYCKITYRISMMIYPIHMQNNGKN